MPITNLQEALPMPESQRATLPLIDVEHGTKLVLMALPKEVEIAPHKAPYPASVQLLTGRIEVLKGAMWIPMAPGERVVLDKDQLHALKAFESSYLLVTHMRD
jgi:quercetin dioxygenase-like cupin family protein